MSIGVFHSCDPARGYQWQPRSFWLVELPTDHYFTEHLRELLVFSRSEGSDAVSDDGPNGKTDSYIR